MNIEISGFDWDDGNIEKCAKHGASIEEIEQIFHQNPGIAADTKHSDVEQRYIAIGKCENSRPMFVAFTMRKINGENYIRPISARYMHEKEVLSYEKSS
ncbi:MAG: hypothetical protein FD163_1472 [Hyphomonadaceae bacterium]|nr:MAG: hypothetical protein FD128_1218 [Hyphomonadaceae bacterium]KAF0184775.1 MAG: hypothetical protein FD163_1472 [Hyphomonadaceae bacterium]